LHFDRCGGLIQLLYHIRRRVVEGLRDEVGKNGDNHAVEEETRDGRNIKGLQQYLRYDWYHRNCDVSAGRDDLDRHPSDLGGEELELGEDEGGEGEGHGHSEEEQTCTLEHLLELGAGVSAVGKEGDRDADDDSNCHRYPEHLSPLEIVDHQVADYAGEDLADAHDEAVEEDGHGELGDHEFRAVEVELDE